MKLYFSFVRRIILLVTMLSVVSSATVLAAPENLFGYTVVDSGYTLGSAGAINGERNALPTTFTAINKVNQLNSDPAIFNFFQGNESRLVLRQTNYGSAAEPNKIIDPLAASWNPLVSPSWSNVANLHAVATKGQWLYATGYDLARISVVNMASGYTETNSYQFPTAWPAIALPAGAVCHGEGVTVVENNLYALFTVNPNGGYEVYSNSIVVKFSINPVTGALTYVNKIEVGKNAFTLEHFNNKLYVCALGGMQKQGSANSDTRLDIINLSNFTKASVSTTAAIGGDFRDITIVDANNAYIFVGHYDANFANMIGGVYRTSVANIPSPGTWTKVNDVNAPGYLWGIYADANRLWFVKGNQVDIFGSLPSGAATATKTFTVAQLGQNGGHLNSATIIAPDKMATRGVQFKAGAAKSFASHSILAQQARKAAEELKAKRQ